MRVGIDGRYIADHYPGIGRYAYNLVRALASLPEPDDLTVFFCPEAANTRYDLAELARMPAVTLAPVSSGATGLRQHLELPRRARALALDVFHSPSYGLPAHMPCPVVATLHDLIPWAYPQDLPNRRARLAYRLLVQFALWRASQVIVDAEATRRDLRRWGVGRQVNVIPLAADAQFRPCTAEQCSATLARLGVTKPYLLYVGINKPHKNLLGLLRAWAALPPGVRGEHTLVWAGPMDERYPAELCYIQGLPEQVRVQRLGSVAGDALPHLYAGARWFVFPSLYEGFGLPALEALACGTPVLCGDSSALPEVVGDAALTFDPTDALAMSSALARALGDQDLRSALATRGLTRARLFGWDRTALATRDVYRTAVGTR